MALVVKENPTEGMEVSNSMEQLDKYAMSLLERERGRLARYCFEKIPAFAQFHDFVTVTFFKNQVEGVDDVGVILHKCEISEEPPYCDKAGIISQGRTCYTPTNSVPIQYSLLSFL